MIQAYHHSPGERVQSGGLVERQSDGPDAGDAHRRTGYLQALQLHLRRQALYNLQMGAAELGGALQDYRGNYILAFAVYNAGRGRVREWIERFGDPRDPKVDPVD